MKYANGCSSICGLPWIENDWLFTLFSSYSFHFITILSYLELLFRYQCNGKSSLMWQFQGLLNWAYFNSHSLSCCVVSRTVVFVSQALPQFRFLIVFALTPKVIVINCIFTALDLSMMAECFIVMKAPKRKWSTLPQNAEKGLVKERLHWVLKN